MRNIISIANRFILENHIHPLPLELDDLARICKKLGYRLFSYTEAADTIKALGLEKFTVFPAFVAHYAKQRFVFFDDKYPTSTRLFSIAHEIGHIVLQHNYSGAVGYTQVDNALEREADTFAYQLLAPLCILRALNVSGANEIESRSLLDPSRAKKVHTALRHYKEQPYDSEMIRSYGIILPRQKINIASTLILFAILLVSAAIFLRELPDPQPPAETTQDFFVHLVEKHNAQTEKAQPAPAAEPQTLPALPEQSDLVYIAPHGERYHKENCYHIKNSTAKPLTRTAAESDGYTPCKTCYK